LESQQVEQIVFRTEEEKELKQLRSEQGESQREVEKESTAKQSRNLEARLVLQKAKQLAGLKTKAVKVLQLQGDLLQNAF